MDPLTLGAIPRSGQQAATVYQVDRLAAPYAVGVRRRPSPARGVGVMRTSDDQGGLQSHRGIVRRVPEEIEDRGGDLSFGADYTVTSTTDNGGQVLTDVEVILCFWGSFWSATPPPSPSADEYKQAFTGVL